MDSRSVIMGVASAALTIALGAGCVCLADGAIDNIRAKAATAAEADEAAAFVESVAVHEGRQAKSPEPIEAPKAPVPTERELVWGDTLWALSLEHGCSVEDWAAANDQVVDADVIYAGDVLVVPDGSTVPCSDSTASQ